MSLFVEELPKFNIFQEVIVDFDGKEEICSIFGVQFDDRKKTFRYMMKCCDTTVFSVFQDQIIGKVK